MKRFFGLIILLAVVAALFAWQALRAREQQIAASRPPALTVVGKIGGEKKGFLEDPEVQRILSERFGLTVSFKVAGSVEMVRESTTGLDYLWPASQVSVEYFRQTGNYCQGSDDVFHSPIVLYSWQIVADALCQAGLAAQHGGSHYTVDFPKLVAAVEAGRPWSELGLPQLHGRVGIISTDPARSNSGNTFAGLLANTLSGGEVATLDTLDALLPRLQAFFARMGFLDHSSGKLFAAYLTQGVGAHPLIVGYENQLVEFSLEHPEALDKLQREVRLLYPQPTAWASHPLIALNEGGTRLATALADPEIQQLAWERHGFRSGLMNVQNDPAVLQGIGLPETITAVQPVPSAAVMTRIVDALAQR